MVDLNIKIPAFFLDDEIRCGYYVPSKMKEVWAVEIDLLVEFDKMCKNNDIKYYVDGGTLLGAVRHKGYIPWDDDIDIIMTRKEYSKLSKIASEVFSFPYFFQTNKTDPGSSRGHAQLRNSMTAAILGGKDSITSHNQGIFIDIFPVDVVPDNKYLRMFHKSLIKFFLFLYYFFGNCSVNYSLKDKRGKWKLRLFMNKYFYGLSSSIMDFSFILYERVCSLFNKFNSQYYSLLSLGYEKFYRQRSKYEKSIDLDFEFIKVPAPYLYEDVLDLYFGDWKKYVVGTSLHGSVCFDTDKSYKEYKTKE